MVKPVIMPKVEMSQEAATIIEWLKQEGDEVEKGVPILNVETDKVAIDVESPATGILKGIRGNPGDVIPVTEIIGYVVQPGEDLPQAAPPADVPLPEAPGPSHPPALASPVARRLAGVHGVDLTTVDGTGPRGRVMKADVELAMRAIQRPAGKVRATPAARRVARERGIDLTAVPGSGPRGRVQAGDVTALVPAAPGASMGEVIPLTGMRRTIAERLTVSYQTAPHITLTVRVDMTNFEATRAQLNVRAEAKGMPRVSVTALLVKAVAWALKQHPMLNSTLHEDEIHLLPQINVGVAVALEQGLIVPVVRDADRKGIAEIAGDLRALTARAREGALTPADVAGGTFTLSNLGSFGIEQFTAIINPPQAAILAVGASQLEPVVDEAGEVTVRPVMRITLSADHRIVDGAVAAYFLKDVQAALEDVTLLLW